MPRNVNKIPEQVAAHERGDRKFYVDKKCGRGHISERYVSSGDCCECTRLRHIRKREKRKSRIDGDNMPKPTIPGARLILGRCQSGGK